MGLAYTFKPHLFDYFYNQMVVPQYMFGSLMRPSVAFVYAMAPLLIVMLSTAFSSIVNFLILNIFLLPHIKRVVFWLRL